ncbi:hypothetical protein HII36_47805 [Nonomuraea sp. NN258]|nr:hypothetical protein [Nonomuraea antri]
MGRSRPGVVLAAGVAGAAVLTGLIWLLGDRLETVALRPDQGAAWYYWKLPEPTFWTRLSAWAGYAAHQVAFWWLIHRGRTAARGRDAGLRPVNVAALAVNVGFVLLHVLQTHLFYDGLAQDVSIFSSQGSVVLLLVVVLILENRRRGLFFGRPAPIGAEVAGFARRYHGYLFAWAAVYTFWYHPAVATGGHLIGFFYLFLLLLQGSLFRTGAHTARWWTLTLELLVVVHGTLVAVMTSGPDGLWPMFLFGFLGVFVITQMHGLGLPVAVRWVLAGAYTGSLVVVHAVRGDLAGAAGLAVRIPAIEYALAGLIALLLWAALRATRLITNGRGHSRP